MPCYNNFITMKITVLLDIEDRIKNKLKRNLKKFLLKVFNLLTIRHFIISKHDIRPQGNERQAIDRTDNDAVTKKYLSKRWGAIAKQRLDNQKKETKTPNNWLDSDLVERYYIRPRVSGDPNLWWLTYAANKYIHHKLAHGLSLGCGDGLYERVCVQAGISEKMDAFDISEEAIEVAKTAAMKEGIINYINYQTADINTLLLPEEKYDMVLCNMSLHHFKELDHIYSEISKSLKQGSLFLFNEFVGPSQFQWTDKQLKIINDILKILPEKYRNLPTYKCYKNSFSRPTIEDMISTDPSEAIRSKDIIPKLENYFSIIEKKDYGGTILNMLLQDIIGNFDGNVQEDMTILKLIFYIEDILLHEGCIESDHSMVVCKKKGL